MKQLEKGEASVVDLKKNLEYAASVLEFLYAEETRQGTTFLSTHTHTHIHRTGDKTVPSGPPLM